MPRRSDPLKDLLDLQERMNRLFDETLGTDQLDERALVGITARQQFARQGVALACLLPQPLKCGCAATGAAFVFHVGERPCYFEEMLINRKYARFRGLAWLFAEGYSRNWAICGNRAFARESSSYYH